jgi:antirestriction protein ArdC
MSAQQQIRERITAEIVAALERGDTPPWRRPWRTSGPPVNAVTGRRYSGVNVLLLRLHQQRLGLQSNRYATFNQWHELGCRVKVRPADVAPGRWGCNVVFCKPVQKARDSDEDDGRAGEFLLLRNFTVFSLDQVEGEVADRFRAETLPERTEPSDFAPAELAIAATGADIRHGGDRAFYRKPDSGGDGDFIMVPHKGRFDTDAEYYETVMHELGHWSEIRVGWQGSYAEGELRAEMTACFAMSELGVPHGDRANCTAYLASWLQPLRADPRFIFRVTADASRATSFLLSFSSQSQPHEADAA